jgi:hypothetical protein
MKASAVYRKAAESIRETRRIWKFPLRLVDEQHIEIPMKPEFLSVQYQGNQLVLWAMVEPENAKRLHRILILGTGNPMPDDFGYYIGTVQQPGVPLVWHVFEG